MNVIFRLSLHRVFWAKIVKTLCKKSPPSKEQGISEQDEGIEVSEERISIKELKGLILEGRCSEAFACGTAAIITPIDSLHDESGEAFHLKTAHGPIARKLREELLGIQQLTVEDHFGWIERID